MIYVDTSVVVAALTTESSSVATRDWLAMQEPGILAASQWVNVEFHSAVGIKVRSGKLSAAHAVIVMASFATFMDRHCTSLPIRNEDYSAASRFLTRPELGLRAGDALHVAIANGHRAVLCTIDQRMFSASLALGLDVRKPA
jgi:uncharacterized protein